MPEWVDLRFEDLAAPGKSSMATGPFGSAVSARHFRTDGVPMIRGSNLSADVGVRLVEDDIVFLGREIADRFPRSMVREGDLVFTCWGTLGQIGYLDGHHRYAEYIVSNKQMKMTPDRSRVDGLFLYYLMSQPSMLDAVTGQAIGSSVPGFNLGQLRLLKVRLPPLPTQRAIAEVLGALDDKIAANQRVETLSEALLAAELTALQRTSEGRVVAASDLVEFNPWSAVPTKPEPVYVDMQKLPTSGSQILTWGARPAQGGARFVNGDTLLARITPCLENRKVGFVDFLDAGESALGSTEFVVMRARPGFARPLSFLLAIDEGFRVHAIRHMVGSSGRQRVSASALAAYELRLPLESEAFAALGMRSEAIFALLAKRRDESRLLAELRDTLLPHLMSGRLTVREAEKQVEEVL